MLEMAEAGGYVSYLIRIRWEQAEQETASIPSWRAEVESIQTGETIHFSELAELTRFFQKQTMGAE